MPDQALLECFDNPHPDADFVIEHIADEFTSVCPMTGHPDFARVILRYEANHKCVELKSLKLYYQSFRNEGIFYENVTNVICKTLVELMEPKWLVLKTQWTGRGGIHSNITATCGNVPPNWLND